MSKTLLIRADAGERMGTGHLMRALALAQCWKAQGGEVIFLTHCQQPRLLQRLHNEKFLVHSIDQVSPHLDDWRQCEAVARHYKDSWFVLDGYHFGFDYQESVRNAGFRLLLIDDMAHLAKYTTDILVNQNPGAHKLRYNTVGPVKMCLGVEYCLLRREFCQPSAPRTFTRNSRKILITAGGSDPHNMTASLLEAFDAITAEKLEIVAVAGAANPKDAQLRDLIARSPHDAKLVSNVKDMSQVMQWADVAVSGAGTTSLELAAMGVPSILVSLFDNQKAIGGAMGERQAAIHAGEVSTIKWSVVARQAIGLLNDGAQRQQISETARKLVDGKGGERIIALLNERMKKAG